MDVRDKIKNVLIDARVDADRYGDFYKHIFADDDDIEILLGMIMKALED